MSHLARLGNLVLSCVLTSAALALPQLGTAATLYDNFGGGDFPGGVLVHRFVGADDFTLSSNARLDSGTLEFYSIFDWDGQGEWAIYADDAGSPGAIHSTGDAQNTHLAGNIYTFDFGQSVLVAPSEVYWLGFHALYTGPDWSAPAWKHRVGSNGNGSYVATIVSSADWQSKVLGDPLNLETWRGPSPNHDNLFSLEGTIIPEPSTGLLLGLGLALSSFQQHRG